ncbi:hypothetical protein Q8A67_014743 [Cirrhinus molitorella]|uniref:Uncharacterized protein n=1 Tax=Cirrhinus molitorella TaxID=172907 RepID=A0AA88PK81_9TELE|nr:hypothetical protein Q8A67_014743 [Cirrhinus molitorella]
MSYTIAFPPGLQHGVIRFQETVVKGDVNSTLELECVQCACAERAFVSRSAGLAGRTGDLIDFNRLLLAGVRSRGERHNPG